MYRVEIGDHLELEVISDTGEGKPPLIWIRDSIKCENCHPSIFLDPFEIQPLLNELAEVASVAAEVAANKLGKVKLRVTNSLEVEIIGEKSSDHLGIEIPTEELPIVLVYDGSSDLEKRPSVITLRLSDIAPLRDALKEISDYFKSNDAVLLYNEGTLAMQRGDLEQAIACLRQAIVLNPQHNLAAFNLAMCYDLLGQIDDALLWYQRAMDLDPNDPDPVYNIAEIHFRKKKLPQAEKLCRQALDLFQKRFESAHFMPFPPGNQDVSREQFLADTVYKKAGAHRLMALIQANEGKMQKAQEALIRAMELDPDIARKAFGHGSR